MLVTGGEDVCKGPCHEPSFYHVDQVVPHRMLIDLIVSVTQYTFFILQIHIIGVRFVKKIHLHSHPGLTGRQSLVIVYVLKESGKTIIGHSSKILLTFRIKHEPALPPLPPSAAPSIQCLLVQLKITQINLHSHI